MGGIRRKYTGLINCMVVAKVAAIVDRPSRLKTNTTLYAIIYKAFAGFYTIIFLYKHNT